MFTPPAAYHRRARRKGQSGYDVAVMQLNLRSIGLTHGGAYVPLGRLVVDGAFGPATDGVVRLYQEIRGYAAIGAVDGIAGYLTDRAMAIQIMHPSETRYSIPRGLEKGMCEGECAFDQAAFARGEIGTDHGLESYVDAGWAMDHIREPNWSEDRFKAAFDGVRAFDKLGRRLREGRDGYSGALGPFWIPAGPERPWYCAIGAWNWPAAADHYAKGETNWHYVETLPTGQEVTRAMDEPAYWIEKFEIDGVHTGHDWFRSYVEGNGKSSGGKIAYVTEWTN